MVNINLYSRVYCDREGQISVWTAMTAHGFAGYTVEDDSDFWLNDWKHGPSFYGLELVGTL